jgi:hypothetical protein
MACSNGAPVVLTLVTIDCVSVAAGMELVLASGRGPVTDLELTYVFP